MQACWHVSMLLGGLLPLGDAFWPTDGWLLYVVASNLNGDGIGETIGASLGSLLLPGATHPPAKGYTLNCCCQESHINLSKGFALKVVVFDMDGMLMEKCPELANHLKSCCCLMLQMDLLPVAHWMLAVVTWDFGKLLLMGWHCEICCLLVAAFWWQVANKILVVVTLMKMPTNKNHHSGDLFG